MTTRTVTGSHPLFLTPSAVKLQAAVNGNGESYSPSRVYQLFNGNHSPHKANPAYKGKWYAPMIDNPAYKGEWAPRKIPNPNFFEDKTPVKSLSKIVRLFYVIITNAYIYHF